jgi:hypothetical protein
VFDSEAGYHRFKADDGSDYGSFEVFWFDGGGDQDLSPGWYWWACLPGCMPDGEPSGPFASSMLAKSDALEE